MSNSDPRFSAGSAEAPPDDHWSVEEIDRLIRQAAARRGWEARRQKGAKNASDGR